MLCANLFLDWLQALYKTDVLVTRAHSSYLALCALFLSIVKTLTAIYDLITGRATLMWWHHKWPYLNVSELFWSINRTHFMTTRIACGRILLWKCDLRQQRCKQNPVRWPQSLFEPITQHTTPMAITTVFSHCPTDAATIFRQLESGASRKWRGADLVQHIPPGDY